MKLCHLFKITYKGSHFFSDILNITRSLNAKLVFKYCGCPITKNIVSPSKYRNNMKGFKYTMHNAIPCWTAYGHREILLFICKSFSMLSIWTSKSVSFHSTPQPGLYHYCCNHTLDAPESSFTFKLSPYILWLEACPPNKTETLDS